MGKCIYCGATAGFLRTSHRECAEKHRNGLIKIRGLVEEALHQENPLHTLNDIGAQLKEIADSSFIRPMELQNLLVAAWEQAVDHFLEDGNLDAKEEAKLACFMKQFGLTQEQLDMRGFYTRFMKGVVLRELMEGKVPSRVKVEVPVFFNFQKDEKVIWVWDRVGYYEEKTRRQYVGGTRGLSIRVARGVYFRIGSFRGRPVETTERVPVDTGLLVVTNKHLYFHGRTKTFRIRLDKIVAFIPFENGVGIQREATISKPQLFVTDDGWFTYNVVVNASRLLANSPREAKR